MFMSACVAIRAAMSGMFFRLVLSHVPGMLLMCKYT